jgi:dihydropteroate synthase
MAFALRPRFNWQLRTRTLALGNCTMLMGIVNITPDSFSDGGLYFARDAAVEHGLRLLDEGADLLDLGGESTRPNASPLSAKEEQVRLLPVLRGLLEARPGIVVSVDTYHASTAEAAIEAGAEIVNDVSGLLWDPRMAQVLAETKPGAVLMHTRGSPRQWSSMRALPHEEILPLVLSGLTHTLALAHDAGIPQASVVLDPGFGFGKLGDENFTLLAHLRQLHGLGYPLLAGISRKRFLTRRTGPAEEQARAHASTAAHTAAVLAGAHLLRVHDIIPAKAAIDVADALLQRGKD